MFIDKSKTKCYYVNTLSSNTKRVNQSTCKVTLTSGPDAGVDRKHWFGINASLGPCNIPLATSERVIVEMISKFFLFFSYMVRI